ncbi:hypothetical protein CJP74_06160 [Psittacicella melopsittaci]|uniref:Membrane protein insertase YidC n=1 Tax=Psittacicella melopsittaci TaxID=2028576 RepID=A0A3A1Y0U1_9GAMM|nr:membrane protein insertase YidC [Psittacicella melopsittaci]RIY31863.1 hypothetical protein CJP74_06160 [Psittacicella melopsittaci]
MNQTRGILFIVLAVLSFLLFQAYIEDTAPKPQPNETVTTAHNSANTASDQANAFSISNDVLKLTINSKTGDFIGADLLQYDRTVEEKVPLTLLSNNPDDYLRIVNGLAGTGGTDSQTSRADFTVASSTADSVTLTYTVNDVTYNKTIKLEGYQVLVTYTVENKSDRTLEIAPYSSFVYRPAPSPSLFSTSNIYGTNQSYAGLVISTDSDNYEKVSNGDIEDNDFKPLTSKYGWTAISQHFFVTAYVPEANNQFTISTNYHNNGDYIINTISALQNVAPGTTVTLSDKYWIGPKLQDQLETVAKDLDLVVDYGWAWFLSLPLFKLMQFLHSFINNWGITIIALTLVVRLIISPLSRIQFRNQALMRVIQPELAAANERAGEDRMRRLTETQKVFKKYGASQFTGCFPALIQMPIFLALFYLVNEAVELRHQPFLWIKDLSQADPYFILPILNGLVMIFMFSLTPMPENMDPMQRKIMKMMPYIFVIFFLFLPSGLILYYIVSNIITILFIVYYNRKLKYLYANNLLPTYKVVDRPITAPRRKKK